MYTCLAFNSNSVISISRGAAVDTTRPIYLDLRRLLRVSNAVVCRDAEDLRVRRRGEPRAAVRVHNIKTADIVASSQPYPKVLIRYGKF